MEWFLLAVVGFFLWNALRNRVRAIEERIARLTEQIEGRREPDALTGLSRRIAQLERALEGRAADTPVAPSPAPATAPVVVAPRAPQPAFLGAPAAAVEIEPSAIAVPPVPIVVPSSLVAVPDSVEVRPVGAEADGEAPAPVAAAGESAPSLDLTSPLSAVESGLGRLRQEMASEEWEALVGASWLNKVGALVLVIGIALFLGYSLTQLGPLGRISVGLAVSLTLLAGGVVLERRELYAMFARGLIGAGWAALYFTAFAAHGVPASRVIENTFVASVLLFAVAVGMLAHSLRYRSQTVTSLAYFIAFTTLTINPSTWFSTAAALPLALSLLYVVARSSWYGLGIVGIVTAYASYLLTSSAMVASEPSQFYLGHALLWVYWAAFEAFDIRQARSGIERPRASFAIAPLNTCGALGIGFIQWATERPQELHVFAAVAAIAFGASALVRARFCPPSMLPENASAADRMLYGGYEAALTIAATLAAFGIIGRFSGATVTFTLLLEAEFLFIVGLRLQQRYMRVLAAAVFSLPLADLLLNDLGDGRTFRLANVDFYAWTPGALVIATVATVNRVWGWRTSPAFEQGYSYLASFLIVLALGFELPLMWVGLAWLVFAAGLLELKARELRIQCYAVGTLALLALAVNNVLADSAPGALASWQPLAPAAAFLYGACVRIARHTTVSDRERRRLLRVASTTATTLLAIYLWNLLPVSAVALAWAVMAVLLWTVGNMPGAAGLRTHAHAMAVIAGGRLFLANLTADEATFGFSHRLLSVVPMVVFFYRMRTVTRATDARSRSRWTATLEALYTHAAAAALVLLVRFELGRAMAVAGWLPLMLVFLRLGLSRNDRPLRYDGYAIAALAALRCSTAGFYLADAFAPVWLRLALGIATVGSLYAAQFMLPRRDTLPGGDSVTAMWVDRHARAGLSAAGTLLLAIIIYHHASETLLTMSWAVQGGALLAAGFMFRDRILRISGLLLLTVCILKLFAYDFRNLEALPRILSFIALGVLLLATSWVYTRFREQLKRYL